jgi:Domain of unknown function (DUF4334)/GXWXG protein
MSEKRLRTRLDALRSGPAAYDDLEALWADCAPVRADQVLGSWAGSDFGPGHPVHEMLATSAWHGKRFESTAKAHPLICRDADGALFSNAELGHGLASLWDIEFRGEVTASMVYDGQPVVDHFKRVDDDTLLGIMNGKGVRHEGRHYYFVLERES